MEQTFTNKDRITLPIEGMYSGQSCFLILCGPSLINYDLVKLTEPGILSMGVNNSPAIFRPNLWTCVDHPARFMISVWKDPTITKFVPFHKHNNEVFDNYNWKETSIKVEELPNIIYYHRNEHFDPDRFFKEKTVNWGNHKKHGGGRSVMMAAIKILYMLGIKNIFLLGCDFKMEYDKKNYAWNQNRTRGSVNCNNNTYKKMIERYMQLLPIMKELKFNVYNCNPESHLDVFPFISYDDALSITQDGYPDINTERVEGLYERFAEEEEKKKKEKIKLKEKEIKGADKGVIYYNVGKGSLVRLAVSLYSCVKYYNPDRITILAAQDGYEDCKKIADHFKVNIKLIELEKLERKEVLLNKCLLHKHTPYENTIFIDSDTIILKSFEELHDLAQTNKFVATQFANWTTQKSIIKKRILEWKDIEPDLVNKALTFGPSVNTGVFAFTKDSELMNGWFDIAKKGTHMFIPDEQCCHLLLPKYKHTIVPSYYNCSCKYDKVNDETRIIHYHGKKHCRIENKEFLYNSNIWYEHFENLKNLDFLVGAIKYDHQLTINIDNYKKIKE